MYVDTPVKDFSSGMESQIRICGCSLSNPDILIDDEVFIVGDAAFQKKAINKIKNINTEKEEL